MTRTDSSNNADRLHDDAWSSVGSISLKVVEERHNSLDEVVTWYYSHSIGQIAMR